MKSAGARHTGPRKSEADKGYGFETASSAIVTSIESGGDCAGRVDRACRRRQFAYTEALAGPLDGRDHRSLDGRDSKPGGEGRPLASDQQAQHDLPLRPRIGTDRASAVFDHRAAA